MKIMNVEKKILENEDIDSLISLKANENFSIQKENDGFRCVGGVDLSGQYLVNDKINDFKEWISCDIFAPKHKCSDEPFTVVLSDVNGEINHGILVSLEFEISGVLDENEAYIEDDEGMDLNSLEDLFEENENLYTSCRLIVTTNEDTYESLAERYHVDSNLLKMANQYKEIKAKQCILIPNVVF